MEIGRVESEVLFTTPYALEISIIAYSRALVGRLALAVDGREVDHLLLRLRIQWTLSTPRKRCEDMFIYDGNPRLCHLFGLHIHRVDALFSRVVDGLERVHLLVCFELHMDQKRESDSLPNNVAQIVRSVGGHVGEDIRHPHREDLNLVPSSNPSAQATTLKAAPFSANPPSRSSLG